ncbi:hypothetical protein Tco_1352524 [Tanacetum coccineum]
MDDPNITMKEYIRLEEEKARRRAIVFNDTLTSEATLSCEPTVSSLYDNEIDFRISFDESDDEDYTPTVSCFDDLDFFKDFENEFPVIVYNDALTSKSDYLTESIVSLQHIDEFNLRDETSLFECDEEEQNVLYFNDLFSFNVIYPDDSKSDENNDDDKIDIEHSSGDLFVKPLPDVINTYDGAYAQGSNKFLEIMPFGIPFDPKLFSKDGIKLGISLPDCNTANPKPNRYYYQLLDVNPAYFFSTVYTAYTLNEYNVFDTGPREGKSINVGREFTKSGDLEC